ncbi:MAG: prolyl oligopeptidase family serine peptidase [Bacteroidota bacterium]
MKELHEKYRFDEKRLYVTGLSMGGFATWDIIARHPELFAAAAPICGGADLKTAEKVKNIPLWVFHGALDTVVLPSRSRGMVAAIQKAGGKPKYTEYPNVYHGSWKPAYQDPDFLKWMFSQSK